MADAALKISQRVIIACANTGRISEIKGMGFQIHALPSENHSIISLLRIIFNLIKFYRSEKPQIIHNSSVLMCFVGSIANLFYKPAISINAITGVGYLFTSNSIKAKSIRTILEPVLKLLWSQRNSIFLFQNADDRELFATKRLAPFSSPIIKGSGVDIKHFKPKREYKSYLLNKKPLILGCATRLLKDKGLEEMIKAVAHFGDQKQFELHIAGSLYNNNPSSLKQKELDRLANFKSVRLRGQITNMLEFWQNCDIAILPSHREGLPKSLLEAAACGLPLLGADVPGTREIIRHRYNGLLFKKGDEISISEAIKKVVDNPELRIKLGKKSRKIVEREEFSNQSIARAYQLLLSSI